MSSVTEASTSALGKQGEMWFGWPLHGRTVLGDTSLQFEHAGLRARLGHTTTRCLPKSLSGANAFGISGIQESET